jgi:hypothetical protein
MKKNTFLFTTILFSLLTFLSCKKDSDGPAKDYTALLTNTIWTGEFNYTGKPTQPVSLSFKGAGVVYWIELLVTRTGTWTVVDGTLSVSFPAGTGFKATIANDNTLGNIQNLAANGYALTSAALNSLTDPLLDNTNWTTTNVALHFKSGNKLDMELGPTGGTKYTNISYTRYEKSLYFSLTTGYNWFIVISGAQTMKGANQFAPDPTTYVFQVNKQ